MPIEVIERVNKIGTAQWHPKLLTFQDRHGHDNSAPDPYFQPLDQEIEGVVNDEPIEENVEDNHKDMNNTSQSPQIHPLQELLEKSPLAQPAIYKVVKNS